MFGKNFCPGLLSGDAAPRNRVPLPGKDLMRIPSARKSRHRLLKEQPRIVTTVRDRTEQCVERMAIVLQPETETGKEGVNKPSSCITSAPAQMALSAVISVSASLTTMPRRDRG